MTCRSQNGAGSVSDLNTASLLLAGTTACPRARSVQRQFPSRDRKQADAQLFMTPRLIRQHVGTTSHWFSLSIQHIFHGSFKAHFVPEITRASVMGPIVAALDVRENTTECASGVGFAIGEHALGSCLARDHRVDVSRPDMESIGRPFPVPADRPESPQRYTPRFCVQRPRRLLQMREPVSLPRGTGRQCRSAVDAVLHIYPALFRTRQMSAIGRKRQQIGQRSHIEQVLTAVWNSRLYHFRSLTLPARFGVNQWPQDTYGHQQ